MKKERKLLLRAKGREALSNQAKRRKHPWAECTSVTLLKLKVIIMLQITHKKSVMQTVEELPISEVPRPPLFCQLKALQKCLV